jgi:hypothetical protein
MDWNDWLTLFNTAETFLVLIIVPLAAERVVVWCRHLRRWLRHVQAGQDAVGSAGSEDAQEDAGTR